MSALHIAVAVLWIAAGALTFASLSDSATRAAQGWRRIRNERNK